jgi:hypothetical protein
MYTEYICRFNDRYPFVRSMYIHSFEPLVHSFEPLVHSFEPWVSTLPLITTTTTNDTLSTPYKKRKIITCFNTDNYYDTEYDYEEQVFDDAGAYEMNLGKQLDKTNSFRRIIYRVANSVGMRTGDWEVGGNKNLFFGITFASEYGTVTPWLSLHEMEECMVEEAEAAGDLYLRAGISESSRYS